MGVGVGRLGCHLLLPHGQLMLLLLLLGQLDVVWHRVGVTTIGVRRELVVMGSVGLEHLYDEEVLPLKGDGHGGAVQVVQESGIGKDVKKMTCTLSSSMYVRCRRTSSREGARGTSGSRGERDRSQSSQNSEIPLSLCSPEDRSLQVRAAESLSKLVSDLKELLISVAR